MKIFLETYGCAMNLADSAIIRGVAGYPFTEKPEDADTVIINTCAVKLTTEHRMLSSIKKHLSAGRRVIVTGCLPKMNAKKLEGLGVSIVDSNSLMRLPEALASRKPVILLSDLHEDKISLPHCQDSSLIAVVEISEGCLGNCSFCGTKNARGTLTSYPVNEIKEYIGLLVRSGKKEIWLTSQDTGAYGLDIGSSLPELVKSVTNIPGDFRIRIGMMNPCFVTRNHKGFREMFDSEKVYKFLHIPIQSGSDRILKAMNRLGKVSDFEMIVAAFRERYPEGIVATDIIVGFPGETAEDFQETVSLIRKTAPEMVNISRFGPRPNTPAARLKQLPTEVSKKRSSELASLSRRLVSEKFAERIGKKERLLAFSSEKGKTLSRDSSFRQVVVDGIFSGFVDAEITGSGPSYLKAKVIKP